MNYDPKTAAILSHRTPGASGGEAFDRQRHGSASNFVSVNWYHLLQLRGKL